MHLKKFNKIIFELIEECLNYTSFKRLSSFFERKHTLHKLSELTEKLNTEFYLNEKEQTSFLELLKYLNNCLSQRGCCDYEMPKEFSKCELDKINKEFHNFNGDLEEYNPNEDFSITFSYIIIYYIEKKYSIYFNNLNLLTNLKKF